jgi:hypothetical protein
MTDSFFMFQSAHFKLRLSYLSTHQSLTGLLVGKLSSNAA